MFVHGEDAKMEFLKEKVEKVIVTSFFITRHGNCFKEIHCL